MIKYFITTLLLSLVSTATLAHDINGDLTGFGAGLSHPVLGLDHLLAMLSVGILSAQMGGRAIWTVPTTFVLVMILGGIIGMAQIDVPYVEFGISLSVVLLGAALTHGNKGYEFLGMSVVAIFAVFHGHAHGTEMPLVANPMLYASGFVTGTALIHITGVFFGLGVMQVEKRGILLRACGAAIAGFGVYALLHT